MAENTIDSVQQNDSPKKEASSEADSLINKMAQDRLIGSMTQSPNNSLLGPERAPDSALKRYGIATLDGVTKLPEGVYLSLKHNVENPLQALQTFGMGAGMAVVLKTVLPEGGLAGKLAAGAIGVYFTVEAAKPIYEGYQKAGNATTMSDLNSAGSMIGHATGQFLVDSAIAAGGYKVGSHYTGRVLSMKAFDGFADTKANFYSGLEAKTQTMYQAFRGGFQTSAPDIAAAAAQQGGTGSGIDARVKFAPSERTAPQGLLKGEVNPEVPMEVTVMLKSTGSELKMNRTLERIAQGRQAPLTDAQMFEQFGASKESLSAVTKFAQDNGLKVTEANLTSGRVVLQGTTGQFSEAFHTRLASYETHNGIMFRGREGSLSVPKELSSKIIGILGMDDRPAAQSYIKYGDPIDPVSGKPIVDGKKFAGPVPVDAPAKPAGDAAKAPTGEATKAPAGEAPKAPTDAPKAPTGDAPKAPTDAPQAPPTAPGGAIEPNARRGFLPNEVADAYNFPKESNGQGQAVGIIQLGGGFDPVDNAVYYKTHGLPEPKVKIVEVGGAKNSPGQMADGEVMLDSQVIGAVAPGAQQHIIFAPNSEKGFTDAILRATFPEKGEMQNSAISISWGMNEEGWSKQAVEGMNQAFKKALLKGISIFAASGDDGARNNASGGKLLVDYPAADPQVTGSGGTRLVTSGDGKIQTETVWNNNRPNDAGGGGISGFFPPQEFQNGMNVPNHAKTGQPGRGVPDVAGNADPVTGYRIRVHGSENLTGGTSAVSPLYAALMMRINGALGEPFGKPLNPWLYQNAKSGIFNDVLVGDNGGYKATAGWDATTGLGSIDGSKMLNLMRSKPNLSAPRLFSMSEFRFLGPTNFSDSTLNK